MYAIDYKSGRTEPCGAVVYYSPGYFRSMALGGITKTPDGAPYSVSSIRAAMVGM